MLEWADMGAGGVTMPEGVQGMTGCGTQWHGPVDKMVINQKLDLKIPEVFSNLSASVILWLQIDFTGCEILITQPIFYNF